MALAGTTVLAAAGLLVEDAWTGRIVARATSTVGAVQTSGASLPAGLGALPLGPLRDAGELVLLRDGALTTLRAALNRDAARVVSASANTELRVLLGAQLPMPIELLTLGAWLPNPEFAPPLSLEPSRVELATVTFTATSDAPSVIDHDDWCVTLAAGGIACRRGDRRIELHLGALTQWTGLPTMLIRRNGADPHNSTPMHVISSDSHLDLGSLGLAVRAARVALAATRYAPLKVTLSSEARSVTAAALANLEQPTTRVRAGMAMIPSAIAAPAYASLIDLLDECGAAPIATTYDLTVGANGLTGISSTATDAGTMCLRAAIEHRFVRNGSQDVKAVLRVEVDGAN